MKIAYRELPPEINGWPRPLLDVSVGDADDLRVRCLVDSGAMNTLLPSWVADYFVVTFRAADSELELAGTWSSRLSTERVPLR